MNGQNLVCFPEQLRVGDRTTPPQFGNRPQLYSLGRSRSPSHKKTHQHIQLSYLLLEIWSNRWFIGWINRSNVRMWCTLRYITHALKSSEFLEVRNYQNQIMADYVASHYLLDWFEFFAPNFRQPFKFGIELISCIPINAQKLTKCFPHRTYNFYFRSS